MVIADSRPPIKYLQGHIPRAVNLPTSRIFDRGTLELLPIERLAGIVGDAGIGGGKTGFVLRDPAGPQERMPSWGLGAPRSPQTEQPLQFLCPWSNDIPP